MSSNQKIAIIDYGMGNLHSAAKAVEKVSDAQVIVTNNAEIIRNADRVIFPGVGAIRDCMAGLREHKLDTVIQEVAKTKPLLGICIAMQALCAHSEENDGVDCLNVFDGNIHFFGNDLQDAQGNTLKVPHMGWNTVTQISNQTTQHPIWQGIKDNSYFYFVHSYHAAESHPNAIGQCQYGKPFSAVLARDNIVAVQFHPEKSADNGLQLLKNFCAWNGTV